MIYSVSRETLLYLSVGSKRAERYEAVEQNESREKELNCSLFCWTQDLVLVNKEISEEGVHRQFYECGRSRRSLPKAARRLS
jgi:hypothetical protein